MIFLTVATLVGIANAAQQPRNPPQGWQGKDGAKAPSQKPPRGWEEAAAHHALHSESAYHKLRLPEVLTPVELHHGYKKWKSTRRSLQEKPSQAESSDMPGVSGMPGVTGEINDGMPGATIMPGKTLPIKTRRRLADKDVINEAEIKNELTNLVNQGKATSTVGYNFATGHIQVGLSDAAVSSIFDNTKDAIVSLGGNAKDAVVSLGGNAKEVVVSLGGNAKEVVVSLGDKVYKIQKCYWDDLKNSRSTEISKLELGKKYQLDTLNMELKLTKEYHTCLKNMVDSGVTDPDVLDMCRGPRPVQNNPGAVPDCNKCKGKKLVPSGRSWPFSDKTICKICNGTGKQLRCRQCRGTGIVIGWSFNIFDRQCGLYGEKECPNCSGTCFFARASDDKYSGRRRLLIPTRASSAADKAHHAAEIKRAAEEAAAKRRARAGGAAAVGARRSLLFPNRDSPAADKRAYAEAVRRGAAAAHARIAAARQQAQERLRQVRPQQQRVIRPRRNLPKGRRLAGKSDKDGTITAKQAEEIARRMREQALQDEQARRQHALDALLTFPKTHTRKDARPHYFGTDGTQEAL